MASTLTPRRPLARLGQAKNILMIAAVVLAWIAAALWVNHKGVQTLRFLDLSVYHGAMHAWTGGHQPLYDFAVWDGWAWLPFSYPPFAALVMAPLGAIGLGTAQLLFTELSLMAFAAIMYLLTAPWAAKHNWNRFFVLGLAIPLAFVLEPVWHSIGIGQVNLFLALLIVIDVTLLARGSAWAGVGVGLAAAIKLTPAIFLGYLLFTGRWRALVTAAGTALGATLLAAVVMPRESWRFWTDAMWETTRVGDATRVANQSLAGMLARMTETQPVNPLILAAVLLPLLALGFWRARRAYLAGDDLAGWAIVGLLGSLVSPISWIHHLFWVIPALLVLADRMVTHGRARRWRVILPWAVFAVAVWLVFTLAVVWKDGQYQVGRDLYSTLMANGYALAMLALVLALPVNRRSESTLSRGVSAEPSRASSVEDERSGTVGPPADAQDADATDPPKAVAAGARGE